jgi:hypothetical protein
MGEPPLFDSREKCVRHFRKKYPKGTPFEVIAAGEACERGGGTLTLTFDAPNHVASRHFVDNDGNPGSRAVPQQWYVEFLFNDDLTLNAIEACLVSNGE